MATIKRISIIGDPYNVGWEGPGVHEAAAAFRRAGLVEAVRGVVDEVVDFGDIDVDLPPRDNSNARLLNPEQVKAVSRVIADEVTRVVAAGYTPLIIGGEDSVMLGILEGFRRALGAPIGQVFMDAHGDFNTPETTPSGLIGGMENAILTGRGPEDLVKLFRDEPQLAEENIAFYGTRDLDPQEKVALDNSQVRRWPADRIRQVGPSEAMRQVLEDLRSRVENVYLHIDLDILDKSEMAAHVLPVPNGLTSDEFVRSVSGLVSSGLLCGLAVMVFNAEKDPTGSEAKRVVKLIANFLRA